MKNLPETDLVKELKFKLQNSETLPIYFFYMHRDCYVRKIINLFIRVEYRLGYFWRMLSANELCIPLAWKGYVVQRVDAASQWFFTIENTFY